MEGGRSRGPARPSGGERATGAPFFRGAWAGGPIRGTVEDFRGAPSCGRFGRGAEQAPAAGA
eukprot:7188202-Alexandrium_andersonii.AAC.1